MTNFNDCRKKYFKNQQTTYSEPKHWLDYEQAALAEALEKELPINILDTWREYFKEYGYTEEDGTNLTDLWYKFLGDNGFTQRGLRSRLKAFYCSESIDLPLIPNKEEIIQWLDKVYQADDSCYYIEDKRGDQLRPVHGGGYGAFDGSTNSISFTDLSGVTITSYDGTGIPTIATNDINVTAGTISYLELSNGGIYDFEEQSGTVLLDKSGNDAHGAISGTMTNFWDSSETVKSYKNINGYNESVEFLTNGDFEDGSTDWELIGQWTISGGEAVGIGGATTSYLGQDFGVLDGATYSLTYEILENTLNGEGFKLSGTSRLQYTAGVIPSTVGTHTIEVVCNNFTGAEDLRFLKSGTSTTGIVRLEEVSVKLLGYVPRLETAENTLLPVTEQTDILGLPLENYGRARNDVKIVNTSALALNGTDNYIDTGIIPENNADFYIEAECNFVDSSSQFMGARGNGVDIQPYFYFGTTSSSEQYIFIYGNGASLPVGDFDGESHKFKMTGDGKCYFDDVYKGQMSGDIAGLLNEIWIGGTNSNGVSSSFTDAEINYFKIGNSTGLIRHYVFGEGEGSVVYDKVTGEAFDINGTLDDVWTHNDCARPHNLLDGFNKFMVFKPSMNTYIDIGNIDSTNELTFVADIVLYNYGTTSNELAIISKRQDAGGQDFELELENNDELRVAIGSSTLDTSNSNLQLNTSYQVGFTFKNGDISIYVNGVSKLDSTIPETYITNTIASAWIGARRHSSGTPKILFDGLINNCKIFNSQLSPTEMLNLYNGVDIETDLTHNWLGHGNKNIDWIDTVGSNNGTVMGSPTSIRIPANEAGDLDVFGNELTNPGTEVGSNGSENKFEQPDSYEIYEVPLSLESDGVGDYIDTGIKPNQDLFLDIKFKINILPTGSIDDFLLGSSQSSYGNPKFYLMVDSVTKRFGLRYGTAAFDSNIVANTTDIYDIRFEDKKWYINDNLIHDFTGEADFQTNYNTILLANNTAGTAERFTPMTVFKVRLNDNWYVPIKLGDTMGTQTATANGLYDKINDTITYNGGTGEMPIYNGLMTYGYEDMQADYNDAHYWFNDVFSQDPIRFKTLMYSAQQEGVLLTKALKYTKSYLTKYIPSTFFEAEMIYK